MKDKKTANQRELAKDLRKSRWWKELIQKPRCYYCKAQLTPLQATMDHLVPVSRGGLSNRRNIVVACKPCNTKKADMTSVEWLLSMK